MKALFRIIALLGSLLLIAFILFLIVLRDRRPRIYFAAEAGDTNLISHFLASGTNVNDLILCYPWGGNQRAPLLDIALQNGQVNAVDFLLKQGANPNQQDANEDTPLMWVLGRTKNDVTAETRLRLLKMLLENHADPNQGSSAGIRTALMQASDFGETEMAKILLAAGAVVKDTNKEGSTPLHFAANAEIVKLLITAGADPNARTDAGAGGETPADSALRLRHFEALKVLTNLPALTNQ